MKSNQLYPETTKEIYDKRVALAPEMSEAFYNFSKAVFKEGALTEKTKQLIAVAVAHVTQCPYCIRSHTKLALRKGASKEEVMEAIWIASEMRAGAAYSHAALAIDEMGSVNP
jgi:AhpD family alkylhydroperoxidase